MQEDCCIFDVIIHSKNFPVSDWLKPLNMYNLPQPAAVRQIWKEHCDIEPIMSEVLSY